jgi:hypothetical protein
MAEDDYMKAASPAWTAITTRRTHRGVGRGRSGSGKVASETADFFEKSYRFAQRTFPDLWSHLTSTGQRDFVTELVRASSAPEPRRHVELERVIEAWHRTMALRHNPDYLESVAQAGQGELMSKDELKTALGL